MIVLNHQQTHTNQHLRHIQNEYRYGNEGDVSERCLFYWVNIIWFAKKLEVYAQILVVKDHLIKNERDFHA